MVARGTSVVLMDLCQELGSLQTLCPSSITTHHWTNKPVSDDYLGLRESLVNLLPVEDGGHVTHCSAPPWPWMMIKIIMIPDQTSNITWSSLLSSACWPCRPSWLSRTRGSPCCWPRWGSPCRGRWGRAGECWGLPWGSRSLSWRGPRRSPSALSYHKSIIENWSDHYPHLPSLPVILALVGDLKDLLEVAGHCDLLQGPML